MGLYRATKENRITFEIKSISLHTEKENIKCGGKKGNSPINWLLLLVRKTALTMANVQTITNINCKNIFSQTHVSVNLETTFR